MSSVKKLFPTSKIFLPLHHPKSFVILSSKNLVPYPSKFFCHSTPKYFLSATWKRFLWAPQKVFWLHDCQTTLLSHLLKFFLIIRPSFAKHFCHLIPKHYPHNGLPSQTKKKLADHPYNFVLPYPQNTFCLCLQNNFCHLVIKNILPGHPQNIFAILPSKTILSPKLLKLFATLPLLSLYPEVIFVFPSSNNTVPPYPEIICATQPSKCFCSLHTQKFLVAPKNLAPHPQKLFC